MTDSVRVALSVDALGPRLTGIGRYCLELVRGVPAVPGVGDIRYFRGPHWLDDPEALLAEGWAPARRGRFGHWLDQRRNQRTMGTSVVHGPNFFLPDWAEHGVITVHDLSVLLYPETHPAERVRDFERRFKSSLDRASAIITDSEAVRSEIIAMLGVSGERVKAIPLGVSMVATRADPQLLGQSGLVPGGYTLCVSTFEPRKRIDDLVRAYGLLDPALRRAVPLVLAGASGWRNDALNSLIEVGVGEGWVKRLDFVSDQFLGSLYGGARLFVYPSRYEGFGLPPIEAMFHGVPTIVGNAATLVEVTKGAARTVDASDIEAFATLLAASLEDRAWQAVAATAGRAVAESYRWADCVAATVEVYFRAAQQ
jgi:glycosyltransferase involved in cell wall biosynthesis